MLAAAGAGREGLSGLVRGGGEATDGSICCHRSLLTAFVLIRASHRVQSFGDFNWTVVSVLDVMMMRRGCSVEREIVKVSKRGVVQVLPVRMRVLTDCRSPSGSFK